MSKNADGTRSGNTTSLAPAGRGGTGVHRMETRPGPTFSNGSTRNPSTSTQSGWDLLTEMRSCMDMCTAVEETNGQIEAPGARTLRQCLERAEAALLDSGEGEW